MEDASRTGLLHDERNEGPRSAPDRQRNTTAITSRLMHLAFIGIVIIMVLVTLIVSIYRSATAPSGGLYIMLGLSLLGFVVVELIMVHFLKKGDLPEGKTWFVYFVGGCVVLESIFTDVLLSQ